MIGDLTGAPEPIVIKLFSQDPELLRTGRPGWRTRSRKIKGVVDVQNGIENTISGPARSFRSTPRWRPARDSPRKKSPLDATAI